jgi:hypothetical protein
MKKLTTIESPSREANAARKPTANMSNSACATLPISSDERADIASRFETLLKRFMERPAPNEELTRETIALNGMNIPACADPIEAAGDLSVVSRPSRWPTGVTPDRAIPDLNSELGENLMFTPQTFPGDA